VTICGWVDSDELNDLGDRFAVTPIEGLATAATDDAPLNRHLEST